MSGLRPNELTVWLRPQEAVRPREFYGCALWLVHRKEKCCMKHALEYLSYLDENNPLQFKYIISEYHRAVDYQQPKVEDHRKDTQAIYSVPGPYGEDAHMYYTKQQLEKYV